MRPAAAHLLSHTSGIQNHVAVHGYMDVFRTNLGFATTPAWDELVRLAPDGRIAQIRCW